MSGLRDYLAGENNGPGGTDMIPLPTGEAIDLTGPDYDLVRAFDELREYEAGVKTVRGVIGDELRRRMDLAATWTLRAGSFKATAPSPEPRTEYDVDDLREGLALLVAEGLISRDAADAALSREVTYKPSVGGIRKLKKLGGRVRAVVEGCERQVVRESRPVRVVIEHE